MTRPGFYPSLPARASESVAAAADRGLETFLELRRRDGFLNLLAPEDIASGLGRPRTTDGRLLDVEHAGTEISADLESIEREGLSKVLRRPDLADATQAIDLSELIWQGTDGIDVAEIDDSSVPREIQDRIYGPTSQYMKDQAGVYNTYQHMIVIPVDFAAFPANPAFDVPAIRSFFFGPLGTQTLSSYFAVNSFYKYAFLEGWISSTVRLPASPDASQLSGSDDLIRPALEGSNVDWARFADKDGVVTQDRGTLAIIAPFGGTGATRWHDLNFSWQGRQMRYRGQICFFDCKSAMAPDFAVDPLAYNVGTAVHELGHTLFGLPDRYGTGSEHYGHDYVGAYDIMSNDGSKKLFNAHDRMKIGWTQPRIIHLGHNPRRVYKMRAGEQFSNSAVVIYSDLSPDEYWVLENRNSGADIFGVDPGLPSNGMFLWWVNAVDDVIIMINQHHAGDRPLDQPQPELPVDPPFNGAVREAFVFPQWQNGAIFFRKISNAGEVASFEA